MSKNDMECWILANELLIFKAAAKYRGKGIEYDDLIQEARLAALLALKSYKPEKGWEISSWVFLCVQMHLRNLFIVKKREDSVLTTLDADQIEHLIDERSQHVDRYSWCSPVEEEIIGQCLNDEVNRAAGCLLQESQKDSFLKKLSGIPVKKIAETDCVDARTVGYRLSKANTVMTQHLTQNWCCA